MTLSPNEADGRVSPRSQRARGTLPRERSKLGRGAKGKGKRAGVKKPGAKEPPPRSKRSRHLCSRGSCLSGVDRVPRGEDSGPDPTGYLTRYCGGFWQDAQISCAGPRSLSRIHLSDPRGLPRLLLVAAVRRTRVSSRWCHGDRDHRRKQRKVTECVVASDRRITNVMIPDLLHLVSLMQRISFWEPNARRIARICRCHLANPTPNWDLECEKG